MNISLDWLNDFLPGPLDAGQLGDALTHGGLPVEHVTATGSDTVMDVEVTSNRSDCLSHLGVARELSALLQRPVNEPAITAATSTAVTPLYAMEIRAPDLCPYYSAQVIDHLTVGPSPDWLKRRLEAVGVRSISNVVDITNYVMLELGQPLHAFDFDTLHGASIGVRRAEAGETLVSLDGHERKLAPGMLVIADAARPVALAGVMGGRDTEVSQKTTRVLLESARFDALSIRATARSLAMHSDASYRYERGIDPALAERASRRAVQLLTELAGGQAVGPLVVAGRPLAAPKKLWLRLARLQQVLGLELPAQQVVESLARLRLSPVLNGERIDVSVPSDRLDLNYEIDLVEEVARVIGYDRIPVRDEIQIRTTAPDPRQKAERKIRTALVGAGYFEALTFSFVTDSLADAFLPPTGVALPAVDPRVRKADAKLRPSLLPGLLEAVRRNDFNGVPGAKLFETGSAFWIDAEGQLQEHAHLGMVGGSDYRDCRGAVEAILNLLDSERHVSVKAAEHAGYARGACGEVLWGDESVGYVGLIDRSVADRLSLRESVAVTELRLAPLIAGAKHVPQLRPLPKYPAVRRDLSLLLNDDVGFAAVESAVRAAQPADLESVEYVTTYRGKPLEAGHKSVTLTLVFRSPDTTLTGDAVETAVQSVLQVAKQQLGATLRT